MKHFSCGCLTGALPTAILALTPVALSANSDIQARLRVAETESSQVMGIMHHLTDVYGPRLTGSPQLRDAQGWAKRTMESWGLTHVRLESWDFGQPGWSNQLLEVSVVAPYQSPVTARAQPWTPSTQGLVTANAVLLLPPGLRSSARGGDTSAAAAAAARGGSSPPPMPVAPASEPMPLPTQAELTAYLDSMKDKVRDAIVLVGPNAEPPLNFLPAPLRTPDQEWEARFKPAQTSSRSGADASPAAPSREAAPGRLTMAEVHNQIGRFLFDNGALLRVDDAGERRGVIRAQSVNGYNRTSQVPALVMANSDHGRIARVLRNGTPVKLRVNVQNQFYPEGRVAHNVLGEISGTDKKDEIVMLGAHLDSWAGGTGATDNGAGVAIMMEAVRLLQVVSAKPRRTIRIALWTGEEQGVLGSQAYVLQHFGSFENPKPGFAKLNAYVNIDTGTGKVRGARVFGPPAAAQFVANTLSSFKDWGFAGARAVAQADTSAFYHAGLPGIGLFQDPFDYSSHTHHSNFDTFEEIYEPDMRAAAVAVAALVYALAMQEEVFPRFGKEDMPPPEPDSALPDRLRPAPSAGKH